MADVMAVISKAVFEPEMREHRLEPGAVWATRAYVSQNKGLAQLSGGGRLFLVTVRPPDETLWLVGVLEQPKSDGEQWAAAPNRTAIRDLSAVKRKLRFETGQGLPDKPGVLGMSLQTPRVLAASDIALFLGEAAPAVVVASPPAPASAVSFEAVADAWRRTRHPRFAVIAEALSAREAAREALGASGKKVDIAAWLDIERVHDWRDLPRLMEVIAGGNSPLACDRVTILAQRDDPRLVPVLLRLLEDPPYTAGTSRHFWQAVVGALLRSRDGRARDGMASLAKRYKPINDTTLGAWLATHMNRSAAQMGAPPELSPADEAMLANWESAVHVAKAAPEPAESFGASTTPAELFEAIVKDLADDANRLIYADLLSEKGDDRGELIFLQVERAAGRGSPERSDLERTKFDPARLGEFAVPISTAADSVSFERGFPIAVALARLGLASVLDAPEWGTVRRLTRVAAAPAKAVADFFKQSWPNIDAVETLEPRVLDKLKPPTFSWSEVGLYHPGLTPRHIERFPSLRRLQIAIAPTAVLEPALFAAAPDVVEIALAGIHPALGAGLFAANSKLKRLSLGSALPAAPFAGLDIRELDVCVEIPQLGDWLDAIPSLRVVGARSRHIPFDTLVPLLDKYPSLEKLECHRMVGGISLSVTRSAAGYALTFLPTWRWPQFITELVNIAPSLRHSGITSLILYPEKPRHLGPPLNPTDLDAIRRAWGEQNVESRELL